MLLMLKAKQRGKSMGIQVVHDKYNPVTVRIADIHQIPDLLRPVNRSAVFPDVDVPYTAQRFHEYKYAAGEGSHSPDIKKNELRPHKNAYWCIPPKENAEFVACMEDILQRFHEYKYAAGTAAQILGINFPGIPRAHGQRLPGLPQQLVIIQSYVKNGIKDIIRYNISPNSSAALRKVDGRAEAHIIQMACSPVDCFLKCSPFIVTEFNDVCLGSCHCHHRRFLFSITRNGIIWNNYLAEYISVTTLVIFKSL